MELKMTKASTNVAIPILLRVNTTNFDRIENIC